MSAMSRREAPLRGRRNGAFSVVCSKAEGMPLDSASAASPTTRLQAAMDVPASAPTAHRRTTLRTTNKPGFEHRLVTVHRESCDWLRPHPACPGGESD